MSWLSRLRSSLGRARESFAAVTRLGRPERPLTPEFWDELEETLIFADFGVPATQKIRDRLADRRASRRVEDGRSTRGALSQRRRAVSHVPGAELRLDRTPAVMLIVGVNGSGKTTTIGKLATRLQREGKRVLLVAADTFRAAAAEQLAVWAERSGSSIVRGAEGADPASVVFDGLRAAKARGADVVLVDTAGRLQTKTNLMEELKKMRRVIERELGEPPAETLLVVDGTNGQNAISQAKLFHAATELTGIVITKLDSTAKGGVLVAIVDELEVPIKFVGLGEGAEDLRPFVPAEFIDALFEKKNATPLAPGVRA